MNKDEFKRLVFMAGEIAGSEVEFKVDDDFIYRLHAGSFTVKDGIATFENVTLVLDKELCCAE